MTWTLFVFWMAWDFTPQIVKVRDFSTYEACKAAEATERQRERVTLSAWCDVHSERTTP